MDYIDLLITDNDLSLGPGNEPALLGDRDSIIQDTKHLIRDCGLLSACIGERDNAKVSLLMQKLALKIEDDLRLVPGTIKITRQDTELFFITADTYKFGKISLQAGA
ncbi:MAG: DUF2590 family protein [Methylobacter sp.]